MCIYFVRRVEPGRYLTVTKSIEDPRCPPVRNPVRAQVILSGMTFVPTGPNETEVTYVGLSQSWRNTTVSITYVGSISNPFWCDCASLHFFFLPRAANVDLCGWVPGFIKDMVGRGQPLCIAAIRKVATWVNLPSSPSHVVVRGLAQLPCGLSGLHQWGAHWCTPSSISLVFRLAPSFCIPRADDDRKPGHRQRPCLCRPCRHPLK